MWRERIILVALGGLVAVGCAAASAGPSADGQVDVYAKLVDDGAPAEIAHCASGLAEGRATGIEIDDLVASCEAAAALLNAPSTTIALEVEGPTSYGDDPDLDDLWDRCEAGFGIDCDRLLDASPVGSEYERFGVSCGERPDVLECAAVVPDSDS